MHTKRRSSETIRESSFEIFRCCFEQYYSKPFRNNDDWLFLLIGFIEGDGAILEHKGRCRLVITQKDPKVLIEIRDTLGFGRVKDFGKFSRFIVEDNKNCLLFYLLLNGNLVLEHRITQLSKWYSSLIKAPKLNFADFDLTELPLLISSGATPSLNNGWISGFTDAEGCFSIVIDKNRKNEEIVRARFILDQKNGESALNLISNLFSPVTVQLRGSPVKERKSALSLPNFENSPSRPEAKPSFGEGGPVAFTGATDNKESCQRKAGNVFRLSISCSDIKNPNSMLIRNYFSKFNLKTSKHNSFLIWCEILDLFLGKQPLTPVKINEIRKLAKLVNKFTSRPLLSSAPALSPS